jgi:hypothetical protein
MALQAALCVPGSGEFDVKTRRALKDFNQASAYPNDSEATGYISTEENLFRLRGAQRRFPSCQDSGFRDAYEVGLFFRFGTAKIRADLRQAVNVAGLLDMGGIDGAGDPVTGAVRHAIEMLRIYYRGPRIIDQWPVAPIDQTQFFAVEPSEIRIIRGPLQSAWAASVRSPFL